MNTMIIKKLYNFLSYHQHVKTFTHRLANSVYRSHYISYQINSTAIWKPCFQWLFVQMSAFDCCVKLDEYRYHLHQLVFLLCVLCAQFDNFRFTRGVVTMEVGARRNAQVRHERTRWQTKTTKDEGRLNNRRHLSPKFVEWPLRFRVQTMRSVREKG